MHLQESAEMYLETIFVLSQKLPEVHSVDVAGEMGYSKPSVSRAVGLLKQGGYVEMKENGSMHLTPLGIQTAKSIFERHTVLSNFLQSIGVSKEIADKDACRIEHVIQKETLNAIKQWLEK